jgi:hypothetical protein
MKITSGLTGDQSIFRRKFLIATMIFFLNTKLKIIISIKSKRQVQKNPVMAAENKVMNNKKLSTRNTFEAFVMKEMNLRS